MVSENTNEVLLVRASESHRVRNAIAGMSVAALALVGCWPTHSSEESQSLPEPELEIVLPLTTVLFPTTSYADIPTSTTTTTEITPPPPVLPEPSSPTTQPPIHPWGDRLYQDNGCDEGNTLNVHVQGENGAAISAQVSADFMIGNQKVDYSGKPIPPYEGYSDFVYINPDLPPQGAVDGVRDVCFEKIPEGATVYIETYALAVVGHDGNHNIYDSTEQYYGHAMSHQYYPGAGQIAYMTMVRPCSESGGSAGSITARVTSDGSEKLIPRIVAWSNSRPTPTVSYGFGVENAEFNKTSQENTLRALAGNQKYLLQVQTDDGRIVIVPDVEVASCSDSLVQIEIKGNQCAAFVKEAIVSCRLNDGLIG